jgi:hypothetical protein
MLVVVHFGKGAGDLALTKRNKLAFFKFEECLDNGNTRGTAEVAVGLEENKGSFHLKMVLLFFCLKEIQKFFLNSKSLSKKIHACKNFEHPTSD